MRRTLNNGKAMKALALSFAAAAIFTATASGKPTSEPQVQSSPDSVLAEVPSDYAADWLVESPAGVTPTDLARPYEPQFVGVPQPDGYLSRHGGDEPLIMRDGPDGLLPQAPPAEVVTVSAGSDGFDRDDVAIGFGLGLVLATACAAALAAGRGRLRMAQS
jgi:hypothetical protein